MFKLKIVFLKRSILYNNKSSSIVAVIFRMAAMPILLWCRYDLSEDSLAWMIRIVVLWAFYKRICPLSFSTQIPIPYVILTINRTRNGLSSNIWKKTKTIVITKNIHLQSSAMMSLLVISLSQSCCALLCFVLQFREDCTFWNGSHAITLQRVSKKT